MVARVGQVEVALSVERKSSGQVKLGTRGKAVVAGETWSTSTSDGSEDAAGEAKFANDVVMRVGDVEIACAVESKALRGVQFGSRGSAGDAGETLCAGSGDGGDASAGVELEDDVVCCLGYIEIARLVKDDR